MTPIRWLLSLIFIVQMYLAMAVIAVVFAPWALVSRHGARVACKTFCRWVIFSLRILIGLKSEVRGTLPTGEALDPCGGRRNSVTSPGGSSAQRAS